MADFTGQNIQDTYQRVVQVDGNQLQDGTGSNLPISFNGDDVIIPGALKANSYIVSQSTTIATSGSTIFGNSFDDTHTFSGSVNIGDRVNTDYSDITPALFVRQDAVDRSQIANGFGGSIDFHTQRGSNASGARTSRITSRLTTGAQTISDYYALDFNLRSNDTQIDLMTLHTSNTNTSGRVGILDTTPSYTLDVNGDFRAVGDINAGGNIVGDSATSISGINTIGATGNISSSGGIVSGVTLRTDDYIVGDTSLATGILVNGYVETIGSTGHIIASGHITASGDISASGTIVGSNLSGTNTGDQDLSGYVLSAVTASLLVRNSETGSFLTSIPTGTVSSSLQLPTGTVSSSLQLPGGLFSSSLQLPAGIVSSSVFTNIHVQGSMTASGDVSASMSSVVSAGTGSFRRVVIGDTDVASLAAELHIRNAGSVNVNLDSFDQNGNQVINFLNNQEPDFAIGNYFDDGGFQIRSDNKTFAKFGSDDGDIIAFSGSLHMTGSNGNIVTDGDISASGFVAGNAFRGNGKIYPGYNVSTSHFLGKTTTTNPILRAAGGFNVEGNVTASGNIKTDEFIKLNVNNKFIQAKETGGTTRNILGITDSDVVQLSNQNISTEIKGSDILLSANVTTSGDISASGNIYSDRVEILAQGSARVSSITNTTDYWGPNFQGPYHTANWNRNVTPESDGNVILTRQKANTGFIVPFSCSLVGFDAIGSMNSGENTHFSMSLFTANALSGMDLNNSSGTSPGFTGSLACTGISQGNRGYNRHRMTGSCNIPLSPFSVVFPLVKVDAAGNDDGSMSLDMTYVLKIKRNM